MAVVSAWGHASEGPIRGNNNLDEEKDGHGKGRKLGQGGCLPRAQTISTIQIQSNSIHGKIETWKEISLIGKFVGVWPKEKDRVRWIQSTWKPKGHYDLQLGAKGFFTIIFFNQEDWDRVLEGGPYFFFFQPVFTSALGGGALTRIWRI